VRNFCYHSGYRPAQWQRPAAFHGRASSDCRMRKLA